MDDHAVEPGDAFLESLFKFFGEGMYFGNAAIPVDRAVHARGNLAPGQNHLDIVRLAGNGLPPDKLIQNRSDFVRSDPAEACGGIRGTVGFDVSDDVIDRRDALVEEVFEAGREIVGLGDAERIIDFEMRFDGETTQDIVNVNGMRADSQSHGDIADRSMQSVEIRIVIGCFRFDMNDHIRPRNNRSNGVFRAGRDFMAVRKTGLASDDQRRIDEVFRTAPTDPNSLDMKHTRYIQCSDDPITKPRRHFIEQIRDGLASQTIADPDDDQRDSERSQRIGLVQPFVPRDVGQEHRDEAGQDDERRVDIGREMQSVRLQRLTGIFAGDTAERPGSRYIDEDRNDHDDESPWGRIDFNRLEKQPVDGFMNDPDAGREQQNGFEQRREILDLAMAIRVLTIGRARRHTDRKPGDTGSHQIQCGMGGFGQNTETARCEADDEFQTRQKDGSQYGTDRDEFLLADCTDGMRIVCHDRILFRRGLIVPSDDAAEEYATESARMRP